MTTKCERNIQKKSKSSTSVTERLDAESRRIAKKLYKLQFIHALYGGLDGLSLSFSMYKLVFDFLYSDTSSNSSDMMHDWMMTPGGIAVTALEGITLIGFSLMANVFSEKDKNAFKRFVAIAWPYARDAMKGMKNAYKGIRSALQAAGVLTGFDLRTLVVPMGIFLGVLSIINRFVLRKYVRDPRKNMMKANASLLVEIQATGERDLHYLTMLPEELTQYKSSYILVGKQLYFIDAEGEAEPIVLDNLDLFLNELELINVDNQKKIRLNERQIQRLIQANGGHVPPPGLDPETCKRYLRRIKKQSNPITMTGYVCAAYSGVVDGLYLYMGVLGLAALSSPAFLAMLVFSTFFSMLCIGVRVYEEYDFNRRLIASQAKIELTLLGKELEYIIADMQRLSDLSCESIDTTTGLSIEDQQKEALASFEKTLKAFQSKKEFLHSQVTLSYKSAMLEGIKNGLYAYGAISSVMFAAAMIYALLAVPFPPAFLIACVVAGLVCLIVFVTHALVTTHRHLHPKEEAVINEQEPLLADKQPSTPEEKKAFSQAPKLDEYLRKIKNDLSAVRELEPAKIKDAILEGMVIDPSPQFFFQEWFEVVRSFFSGVSKGQKSVDFTLNAMQTMGQDGHYHDTPIMLGVAGAFAAVYAVSLGLRAHARGFGRPDISEVKPVKKEEQEPLTAGNSQEKSEKNPSSNQDDKPTTKATLGVALSPLEKQFPSSPPVPGLDRPRSATPFSSSPNITQSGHDFFRSATGRLTRTSSVDNFSHLTRTRDFPI